MGRVEHDELREPRLRSEHGREDVWRQARSPHTAQDDVVASLKSRASRAAPLDDAGAGEVYGKASEALGKLSARPKGLQILGGLLAYADAVNTSYDDLKEEAAEDADEAADASDEADEETTPAVALQGD